MATVTDEARTKVLVVVVVGNWWWCSHSSLFGEQISLLPPFSRPLEGINLCEEKASLRAPDQLYGDPEQTALD